MASFADSLDDMDDMIEQSLSDGEADYFDAAGAKRACCLEVMVDPELLMAGPDGLMRTDRIGVSFRKAKLKSAARGGYFLICGKRHLIEDTVTDDGRWITVACMVTP